MIIKHALRSIAAVVILAASLQGNLARGQDASTAFHPMCTPFALVGWTQASDCTVLNVTFTYHGGVTIDHIYAKISKACLVTSTEGMPILLDPDTQPKLELNITSGVPVTKSWSFPSGCEVFLHVRLPGAADLFGNSLYLDKTISKDWVKGDVVDLELDLYDGVFILK